MCAKIIYKGKEEEAYSLTIYKTHALEILRGEKTVEIRNMSEKNESMFLDKNVLASNIKAYEEGRENDWRNPMKETRIIHFYDRGKRFSLDVLLDSCGIAEMSEENVDFLAKEFDFHDYDNEWQQYVNHKDKPLFFWFHICEIIGSTGLD